MTEKLNQEMNIIIKMWHIIVALLGFAFVTGGAYYQVFENKAEIAKIKEWKEERVSNFDLDVREMKTKIEFLYNQEIKKIDKNN